MKIEINGKTLYHIQIPADLVSDETYNIFAIAEKPLSNSDLKKLFAKEGFSKDIITDLLIGCEVRTVWAEEVIA